MPETGGARVLSLVFTDLADSTALKTERGDEAGAALIARHRAHVTRLAQEGGGRIVDFAGDGCFLAFEAPSAAAFFALRLQALHGEDRELPGVRVGIHLGEVTEREGRVEGLAVDLASRIQSLARSAQVLVSGAAAASARQRLGGEVAGRAVQWKSHGPYALKGANEPLEVVEVGLTGLAPFAAPLPGEKARPAARALPRRALALLGLALALGAATAGYFLFGARALDPIRSIAVLPLENLSGDPAQDYFADGMTEALIGELAKLGALDVISRTSVMQYKGAHRPLREIANELGVDGIIEGSVLRDGEQVRITAQLIDARSDHHLWSESYQRELRTVLAIQSEVARAVAHQIELSLTPGEAARLVPPTPVDPRAQDAYFRGRQLWSSFTPEGVKLSLGHFEEAIRIAPDYALPHAAESSAWFLLGQPLGVVPHREALPKAKAAALRALALDEDLGDAHVALAQALFFFEWDFEAAEREFRRASELSPSDAYAHVGYAFLLLALERRAEAYAQIEAAVRLSPIDPIPRVAQIDFFSTAGRFADAQGAIDRILEVDPASPWPLERQMRLLEYEGRLEDAIGTGQKIGALQPDQAAVMTALEEAWRKDGAAGYWRFWQEEWTRSGSFFRAAEAFTATGALDDAFAALERAYAKREGPLIFLAVNPPFAPLHGDPRFAELAKRMNLPVPAR